MWYEIIPSFVLTFGFVSLSFYAVPVVNKLVNGNAYNRDLKTSHNRHFFRRDQRLTGDAYKAAGLDNIPDN